jgi:hypothetical protein
MARLLNSPSTNDNEEEKMKRLFIAFVLFLFIGIAPQSTEAGRTRPGFGEGEFCDCGQSAPPVCFDDSTGEVCNIVGGGGYGQQQGSSGQGCPELLLLVPPFAALLLKRLFG